MNVTTILSGLLAVSVGVAAAAPASKRAATDELTANRERDTYAIAEQLYRQGHVAGLDDATRKNILTRVCELQQTFVKDFPNSPLKTKALYMRATCAEEIGQKELSREVYKELTSAGKEGKKDDFVASAAYKLATYHFNRALNYADSAQSLQEAAQNYALVEKFSTNNQLVYDARYRRARVYTLLAQNQSGKSAAESQKSALSLYEKYFKTNSPDVPAHIQGAAHYAYAQLLTDIGGDDNLRTALEQFELFLGAANENEQQRSIATLQAARICTKINQPDKAAAYYEELEKLAGDLPVEKLIIDPSATSFIALVNQKHRFKVWKANNDVVDGIQHTASCLQDGTIKINDCCKNAVKEFGLYRWDEKAGDDKPIKENDHAMDEIRYFVNTTQIWRKKTPYQSIF
jgi:hypothetical protein